MVVPIITYAAEVWGIYSFKEVDKIQFKFFKIILGVRQQSMNAAVLGELGIFPLSLICIERSLKYWLKIKCNNNTAMQDVLKDHCATFMGNNKTWENLIKQKLDNLGFSNLWSNQNLNVNMFPSIQRRVRDTYLQEWYAVINNSPKLKYYVMFKDNFEFEP